MSKTVPWRAVRELRGTPDVRATLAREVQLVRHGLSLRELREVMPKTQQELSELLEISQSQLSKLERREDHLLSTLRAYVEALGGRVEVVAVFGDNRVVLRGT